MYKALYCNCKLMRKVNKLGHKLNKKHSKRQSLSVDLTESFHRVANSQLVRWGFKVPAKFVTLN